MKSLLFGEVLHPTLQYLFTTEGPDGAPTTSVEFMNPKDLEYFLNHRKSRPDGILQRFLPTADCNAQIQVIWSPRVTLIQRRVNKNRLGDRNIPAYRRAVTYDGPTYHSEEGLCSGRTKNQILDVCHSIVDHFTNTEHKVISRFVIYFKVSPIPKQAAADGHDTLWLLWASSLRIGDMNKYKQNTLMCRPLNLSPNISTDASASDRAETQPAEAMQLIKDKLLEADQRQFHLSCDLLFSKTIGVGKGMNHSRAQSKQHRPSSAPAGRPRQSTKSTSPVPSGAVMAAHDMRPKTPHPPASQWRLSNTPDPPPPASFAPRPPDAIPSTGTKERPSRKGGGGGGDAEKTVTVDSAAQEHVEWWNVSSDIKARYEAVHDDARQVAQYVDDVVYSLYSHLLRKNSAPFFIQVPSYIRAFFADIGAEKLSLLLSGVLRMTPYKPKQTNPGIVDEAVPLEYVGQLDVWYIVSDKVPPFGMQVSEVTEVIKKIISIKVDEIKQAVIERQRTLPSKEAKKDKEPERKLRRVRTHRNARSAKETPQSPVRGSES